MIGCRVSWICFIIWVCQCMLCVSPTDYLSINGLKNVLFELLHQTHCYQFKLKTCDLAFTLNYIMILLPEASYGLRVMSSPASVCVCVCVCVFVCVRPSSVYWDDNLSPAQATIAKIGPEVQNTLVKNPNSLWGSWTLIFKVKLNLKIQIYPILGLWVCLGNKLIPNEVRLSKFGPKMHLGTVKVPIYWHWIFQAVIGFGPIIYTSHVEILYTNIRQQTPAAGITSCQGHAHGIPLFCFTF